MNTKQLLTLAGKIIQERKLAEQARALRNEIRELTGQSNYSWTMEGTCNDGKPSVTMSIKVNLYLSINPDAKHEVVRFTNDTGETKSYLSFPAHFIGEHKGVNVFLVARTESIAESSPAQTEVQQAA